MHSGSYQASAIGILAKAVNSFRLLTFFTGRFTFDILPGLKSASENLGKHFMIDFGYVFRNIVTVITKSVTLKRVTSSTLPHAPPLTVMDIHRAPSTQNITTTFSNHLHWPPKMSNRSHSPNLYLTHPCLHSATNKKCLPTPTDPKCTYTYHQQHLRTHKICQLVQIHQKCTSIHTIHPHMPIQKSIHPLLPKLYLQQPLPTHKKCSTTSTHP